MNKEELIQLHTLFVQVKKYCEAKGLDCDFSKYNDLGITPSQVYRNREDHKKAVFLLAHEFAAMVKRNKIRRRETLTKNYAPTFAV
jgi:hypothetical protein